MAEGVNGECLIFEEDEVFKETNHGLRYGVVVESSEYLSSDDEDENSPSTLKKGTIRVAWHPSGHEEIISEQKVKLADRSLMPGDVVRRLIAGQDSQRGYTQRVRVNCHAQIKGTNDIVLNIDSKDLKNIVDWPTEPGDVTLDNWVGKIAEVKCKYVLKFSDGARCSCEDDHIVEFEDLADKRGMACTFNGHLDNYVGQRLKGEAGDLKKVTWIKTTRLHSEWAASAKPSKSIYPTIEQIDTTCVNVNWLYCCSGSATKCETPPTKINGDNLLRMKQLNCFEPCAAQIGDIYFYTLKEGDQVKTVLKGKKKSYIHYILKDLMDNVHPKQVYPKTPGNTEMENAKNLQLQQNVINASSNSLTCDGDAVVKDNCEEPNVVVATTEACVGAMAGSGDDIVMNGLKADDGDDEYEDVTDESDTDSVQSACSNASSQGRRKKGGKKGALLQTKLMKKKGKSTKTQERAPEPTTYSDGQRVPVEIILTSSFADVMWQDSEVEDNIKSAELYPIHHLDDSEFFPGDFVLENISSEQYSYGFVLKVNHSQRTCQVRWVKLDKSASVESITDVVELSVYDLKDHPDYKFRPGSVVVKLDVDKTITPHQTVGQVFQLVPEDGQIQVCWQDRSLSLCHPHELYLMADDDYGSDDSESDWETDEDSSIDGSTDSWETESEHSTDEEEVKSDDQATPGVKKKVQRFNKHRFPKSGWIFLWLKLEPLVVQIQEDSRQIVNDTISIIQAHTPTLHVVAEYIREILRAMRSIKMLHSLLQFHVPNKHQLSSAVEQAQGLVKEILALNQQNTKHIPCHVKNAVIESLCQLNIELNMGSSYVTDAKVAQLLKVHRLACDTESTDEAVASLVDQVVDSIDMLSDSSEKVEEIGKFIEDFIDRSLNEKTAQGDSEHSNVGASKDLPKCDSILSESTKILGRTSEMADKGEDACNTLREDESESVQDLTPSDSLKEVFGNVCKVILDLLSNYTSQSQNLRSELHNKTKDLDRTAHAELLDESPDVIHIKGHMVKSVQSILMGGSKENQTSAPLTDHSEATNTSPCELKELSVRQLEKMFKGDFCLEKPEVKLEEEEVSQNTSANLELDDSCTSINEEVSEIEGFKLVESAPATHKFYANDHNPDDPKAFMSAVRKEMKLLQSLPQGILVRCYEDRMDLISVLITGPTKTPYEDGLFAFDFQLPNGYNSFPPLCHYISYCSNRLNPNLYEDGKVCVSLLGTWSGKGSEVWTIKSNLLQVLVSIQGLILVPEPYYNEAGYEKQRGTQQALENSQMYNEMATIKLVQSMTNMVRSPPEVFRQEVEDHFKTAGNRIIKRLTRWMEISDQMLLETATTPSCSTNMQQKDASTSDTSPLELNMAESVSGNSINNDSECSAIEQNGINQCQGHDDSVDKVSSSNQADDEKLSNNHGTCVGETDTTVCQPSEPGMSHTAEESAEMSHSGGGGPEFPLLPVSKGFCLSLKNSLDGFRKALDSMGALK